MKQFIAIGMLIVMLLGGSRATVAFHYCSGKLQSVTLAKPEKKSCCAMAANPEEETETILRKAPCCTNLYQTIEIDDFFPSHAPKISTGSDRGFQPAAFPAPLPTAAEARIIHSFQSVFPPGRWVGPDADRLILLCVFRI